MPRSHDPLAISGKVIPREHSGQPLGEGAAPVVRTILQSREEHADALFAEARLNGWKAGQEAARKDFLRATAEAVQLARTQFFTIEPMLAPVVLQVFEKILGKIPRTEIIQAALAEALKESGTGIAVTLRIPPDELNEIRKTWSDIVAAQPSLSEAITAIEADAGLHPGEMILETLKGRTHIGIAYQLARLRYGLVGAGA